MCSAWTSFFKLTVDTRRVWACNAYLDQVWERAGTGILRSAEVALGEQRVQVFRSAVALGISCRKNWGRRISVAQKGVGKGGKVAVVTVVEGWSSEQRSGGVVHQE